MDGCASSAYIYAAYIKDQLFNGNWQKESTLCVTINVRSRIAVFAKGYRLDINGVNWKFLVRMS